MENMIVMVLLVIIASVVALMLLFWAEVTIERELREDIKIIITAYALGNISPRKLKRIRDRIRKDIDDYLDGLFPEAVDPMVGLRRLDPGVIISLIDGATAWIAPEADKVGIGGRMFSRICRSPLMPKLRIDIAFDSRR